MTYDVVMESYAIREENVFGDTLRITWAELKSAEVGKTWELEDGDRYPNCQEFYSHTWTMIYKDEHGALLRIARDDDPDHVTVTWYEFV